jgi:glycosyltransferase 2 family protein
MNRVPRMLLVALALITSASLAALAFFRVGWQDGGIGGGGGPGLILTPRFPIGAWLAALPAHAGWVAPFVLLLAAQVPMRAVLWPLALPEPRPRPRDAYHALALGGLANNVVPGKLGVAASAWVLRRWVQGSFTTLLSALLLVKLAELAALVTLGAALVLAVQARLGGAGLLGRAVLGGVALLALLVATALAAAHASAAIARRIDRGGRARVAVARAGARRHRAAAVVAALGQGLEALRSPRRLAALAAAALAPVAAGALGYGLALDALGAQAGIAGGGLVLVAITLGQLTPGLPIGLGVHYFVVAWAARQLGVAAADAAALAALSHAAGAVTHVALGLGSALVRRNSLRALWGLRRVPVSTANLLAAESPLLSPPGRDIRSP